MVWKLTLIINALLMGVLAFGSAASQVQLRNNYIQYPDSSEGEALPAISALALRIQWVPVSLLLTAVQEMILFSIIEQTWKMNVWDQPRKE